MKYVSILFLLLLFACGNSTNEQLSISTSHYGYIGAEAISLFHLKNKNNTIVKLTNYGGIITHLLVADKNGKMDDVVLGYDSLAHYVEKTPYFGAIVGRYANRIAKGRFTIADKTYTLATNNGDNALHGGINGFDKKIWQADVFKNEHEVGVILSRISPDGEEGYPGNLKISVTYSLNNQDELRIIYTAETDQTTVVNLTNHSYFNLKGADKGSIADHILMIDADRFTPADENAIPTGALASVKNTPFDFTTPTPIGQRINQTENAQISIGNGYDQNFVLNKKTDPLELAATVYEPTTGRFLEVRTTEPGVQFYTGNYLGKKFKGKLGHAYASRDGFCLETQHFPDSPNQPDFPSTLLKPNEQFKSVTVFRFSVK